MERKKSLTKEIKATKRAAKRRTPSDAGTNWWTQKLGQSQRQTAILVYLLAEYNIPAATRYLRDCLKRVGYGTVSMTEICDFVEELIVGRSDDDIEAYVSEADDGITVRARRARNFIREDGVRLWVMGQNENQRVLPGSRAVMETYDHHIGAPTAIQASTERRHLTSTTNRTFAHRLRKRIGIVLARASSEKPEDKPTLLEKAIAKKTQNWGRVFGGQEICFGKNWVQKMDPKMGPCVVFLRKGRRGGPENGPHFFAGMDFRGRRNWGRRGFLCGENLHRESVGQAFKNREIMLGSLVPGFAVYLGSLGETDLHYGMSVSLQSQQPWRRRSCGK